MWKRHPNKPQDPIYEMQEVLAARTEGDRRQLLVLWKGHTMPTWVPEDKLRNSFPSHNLASLQDENDGVGIAIGPSSYMMYAGDLCRNVCCSLCESDPDHVDGFDYRLYVDASVKGSVSVLCFPMEYSLKFHLVYEIHCKSPINFAEIYLTCTRITRVAPMFASNMLALAHTNSLCQCLYSFLTPTLSLAHFYQSLIGGAMT